MAIIRAPNDGFEVLIQTLLNKERLAQQKEDLNLRKKDFELRQTQAQIEQQRIRDAQMGAQAAVQFLAQQGVLPGFGEAAANVSPGALPAFAQGVGDFLQGIGTGRSAIAGGEVASRTVDPTVATVEAGARQAGAEADVAQATTDERIREAGLRNQLLTRQVTGAELSNANLVAETEGVKAATRGQSLANTYAALRNERDPQRLAQARALWETGQMTWGQAREASGLAPTDLIDDNTIYIPPAGTQANAEEQKALGFARMMQTGAGIIDALEAEGVRLSLPASLMRQSQSATFDALVNSMLSSEQRRYVNAQRLFGDAYRFSLSGQQSSDREALRMLNSIAPQVGDDAATLAQKKALRDTMTQVTMMKARGDISAIDGARMGLQMARNTGNAETIKVFEEIYNTTVEAMQAGGGFISNSPTDAANAPSRLSDENLDRLLQNALRPPGG